MQTQTSPYLEQKTLTFISSKIKQKNLLKPVLQLPKSLLSISFTLVSKLKQLCPPNIEIYILYDSMKKQCCTDIIGAEHVDYDGLFHFGYACFSQLCDYQKCWYIMPEAGEEGVKVIDHVRKSLQEFKSKQIKLLICDQAFYNIVMSHAKNMQQQYGVQVARLPFDKRENDKYFGFGYYCSSNIIGKSINIAVIKPEQSQSQDQQLSINLLENLYLSSASLHITSIYYLTPSITLNLYQPQTNKRLMQRISQISELPKYTTFGILVSNPSTNFCQEQIQRCRAILSANKLKHLTFMMNNLNQCKLGNFPQIEVYVIISCYNYSLYSVKDFYRVVVTPFDLQVAFCEASFQNYMFDFNQQQSKLNLKQLDLQTIKQNEDKLKQQKQENSLVKVNNELAVNNIMQTLEFYKQREYKGLTFGDKKQVQKIKMGKIGIATQYKPINEEQQKNK